MQTTADDFSSLFDFLPIGAYRSSPEGLQLRANPALVALNGYASEAEQLAGVRNIASEWYVDPERRAQFAQALESDGFVRGFESEVWRHRSRERIWISENAHAVRGPDGRIRYYEGTVEDISERVAAQAALARSSAQLRELTRNLHGVLYQLEFDSAGARRLGFVSDGVQALFGIDAAAAMALPDGLRGYIHDSDRAQVTAEIEAAAASKQPLVQEFRIVAADGCEKWVQMSSSHVAGADASRPVRCGVILDIGRRKAAERALREADARWKLALDSSGDGVWDWDLEAGIESYSLRFKELYGYADHEIDTRHDAFDEHTHPEDRARMQLDRQAHLDGRSARYVNEHRVRCKNGDWKWVLARGLVIRRDAAGRPLRMIGTHTDISDRKAADALRRERDRAEAADRTKTALLSRLSHELRTPLNGILGCAQLLAASRTLGESDRVWVQQVLDSGRHLLALVDDVLDLSSAQGGAISLVWADLDPLAVAAESWSMLAAQAAPSSLRFELVAANGRGPRVRADKRRLTQVMGNLLSNAIKYNRRGGSISVSAEACEEVVRINVADDGQGMDAAQLERLFDPFDRLGAQHTAVPGSGLGLSLSRELIQAMGGELTVASQRGGGSTFTVTLRAAAARAGQRELPAILPET